jgi:hypothetical protein
MATSPRTSDSLLRSARPPVSHGSAARSAKSTRGTANSHCRNVYASVSLHLSVLSCVSDYAPLKKITKLRQQFLRLVPRKYKLPT